MRRATASWSRLAPYATPAAVFLALCLALFWRLWWPAGAPRTFGWDAQWEYWGDLQFQLDAYRDGVLPLWNPYDRAGYPFHADPQAGMLYPITWLLLLVGALAGGAAWWLVAVKVVAHFWLAGLGTYALLRRLGCTIAGSYAGGVVLLLGYPMLHNSFSALNWSFAWAPWAMLAIDTWARRPSHARGGLVALTLAMSALAGGLAGFWYGLLVAVPYGAWAIGAAARAAENRGAYLRGAALTAASSLVLFGGLVAAQLGATDRLLSETVRAERGVAFFGMTALAWWDSIGFAVPRMVGENTYLSFAALLWASSALVVRPRGRTLALLFALAVGMACAFGAKLPVLPLLARLIPPFGFFRRSHRYLYVLTLAFAVLTGLGLSRLETRRSDSLRRGLAIAGLAAAVICGLAALGFTLYRAEAVAAGLDVRRYRAAFGLGALSALVGTGLTIGVLARRPSVAKGFVLVAVVAVCGELWLCRSDVIARNMYPVPRPDRDGLATTLPDVPLASRIYDLELLGYRPGVRNQLRDFGGYEDDPLSLSRYAGFLASVRRAPRTLGHLNVAHFYETQRSHKVTPKAAADRAALAEVEPGVWRVRDVAPAVMWRDVAKVVEGDEAAARRALLRTEPGTTAVLEAATLSAAQRARAEAGDPGAPTVAGRLVSLSRNGLVADIYAPADGIVVVHEAYVPFGWTARVDGAPADIVPANSLFRGVFVGPGRHLIEMTYTAPRFLLLAALQLAALLTIGVLLLTSRRRAARARGDADGSRSRLASASPQRS